MAIKIKNTTVIDDNLNLTNANTYNGYIPASASRTISAGLGLSGGGDLTADRTITVVAGDGIVSNTTGVHVNSSVVRTTRSISTSNGLTGGGDLTANRTISILPGNGLVANATGIHVNPGTGISVNTTAVSVDATVARTTRNISSGNGLTGGGDLSADRTLSVTAGSGIVSNTTGVHVDSTVMRNNNNQSITGTLTSTAIDTGTIYLDNDSNKVIWLRNANTFINGVIYQLSGIGDIFLEKREGANTISQLKISNTEIRSSSNFVAGAFLSAENQIIANSFANTTATESASIRFKANSLDRWVVGKNATNETGSNAGSDFYISRYDDTGVILNTPVSIVRSTGNINLNGNTNLAGSLTLTGNVNITGVTTLTGNTSITGTLSATGVISGNGSGLTSLNANNLTGTVPDSTIASNVVRTTRSISTSNGLTGGGDLSANRILYVQTGQGLIANTTGIHIPAGNGLNTNTTSIWVGAGDGISVNSTSVAVDSTVVRTNSLQTISAQKIFTDSIYLTKTSNTLLANGVTGALLLDDNSQKRISWGDTDGSFAIKAGNYYNANTKYIKGSSDANSGAASIFLNNEGVNGSISFKVAPIGVPDANVIWSNSLDLTTTGLNYNSNVNITGYVSATGFSGNGSALTTLNANNLTGTVPDSTIASNVVRTTRTISTSNGLSGGGDLTANRTISVVLGQGLISNTTGIHIPAGNGLNTNTTSIWVGAGDGISVNSTAVAVDSTVMRNNANQSITGTFTVSGISNLNGGVDTNQLYIDNDTDKSILFRQANTYIKGALYSQASTGSIFLENRDNLTINSSIRLTTNRFASSVLMEAENYFVANSFANTTVTETAATRYRSNSLERWLVGKNNVLETGSNAGSNFVIQRYDDTGVFINTPLTIARDTGIITLTGNTVVAGHFTFTGSISGNGSLLTTLNANNLTGTVPDSTIASNIVRTSRTISTSNGLSGGGDLTANRTISVVLGQGLISNTTGIHIPAGNGLNTNTTSIWVGAGDGVTVNSTSVAVDSTVVRTSRTIATGNGLSGGGDLSASRSISVIAGDGIVSNSTGVHVDSTIMRNNSNQTLTGTLTSTAIDTGTIYLDNDSNKVIWLRNANTFVNGVIYQLAGLGDILLEKREGANIISQLKISNTEIRSSTNLVSGALISAENQIIANSFANTTSTESASIRFKANSLDRWVVGKNATNETGSNAGSDFYISRYDDTGVILNTPVSIVRSTGNINLTGNTNITGDATISGNLTVTSVISGNGSLLTSLNGANLSSGIIPDARIAANVVRTTRQIATANGLGGGGDLSGSRTLYVVAGGGIVSNSTGTHVDTTVLRTTGGQSISGMTILSNTSSNSTVSALWCNGVSGSIMIDDSAQKRISWNDGASGDQLAIKSGVYYNSTIGNSVYIKGSAEANSGAASIGFMSDSSNGVLTFRVSDIGVPGANVVWGSTLTMNTTQLNLNGGEIYNQKNIVGTVSQSAGVPTGKILERGSNANGEYIRYADGTQICWLDLAYNASLAAGANSGDVTWTFPAAFVAGSTPSVKVFTRATSTTADRLAAALNIRSCGTPSGATSAIYVVANAGGTTMTCRADLYVIGRWF